MDNLRAADDEREEALREVKRHITRYKRAVTKYKAYRPPVEEPELVPFTPAQSEIDLMQTRTGGSRQRLATARIDCEECQGWEFIVHGNESEYVKKRKGKLLCEHGCLILELTLRNTTHKAVREPKRLFHQKRNLPHSHLSSRTSEVTPEKLRQLGAELDRLEKVAQEKQRALSCLVKAANFSKDPNAQELEHEKNRLFNKTEMDKWDEELTTLVDEMRDDAEEVLHVANETHSTLNSPGDRDSPGSVTEGERARQEFASRVQQSGESGFQGDHQNFELRGARHPPLPLSHQQTGAGTFQLIDEVVLERRQSIDEVFLPTSTEAASVSTCHQEVTIASQGIQTTASEEHPLSSIVSAPNPTSLESQHTVSFSDQVRGVSRIHTSSQVQQEGINGFVGGFGPGGEPNGQPVGLTSVQLASQPSFSNGPPTHYQVVQSSVRRGPPNGPPVSYPAVQSSSAFGPLNGPPVSHPAVQSSSAFVPPASNPAVISSSVHGPPANRSAPQPPMGGLPVITQVPQSSSTFGPPTSNVASRASQPQVGMPPGAGVTSRPVTAHPAAMNISLLMLRRGIDRIRATITQSLGVFQQIIQSLVPTSTDDQFREATEGLGEIERDFARIHDKYAEAAALAGEMEMVSILDAEDREDVILEG